MLPSASSLRDICKDGKQLPDDIVRVLPHRGPKQSGTRAGCQCPWNGCFKCVQYMINLNYAESVFRLIPPLPLVNTAAPAEPHSAYHHPPSHARMPSTSSSSQSSAAVGRLVQQPRVPPLTSPSSGYSEHSDPYFALTSGERAVMLASAKHFPHSLSFGGCSQHSLLQGTSYSSPCGNAPFGVTQPSAAASFFARAAQRLNLSAKKKKRDPERPVFRTNFRDIIKTHPPPVPPGLLRITGRKEVTGVGKVKVMLRMCPSAEGAGAEASYMTVDSRKKQVTLYDPTVCGQDTTSGSGERTGGVAAPKMFAFDAIFSPDDNQAEVCSSSLCDVITSVVGGSDGCLFVYGHSKLGKTNTMIGNSNSVQELGVIPCAIWWLFRAINEHKHRTGARFSVRVSALEVSGKVEELRDLLADYAAGTEGSGSAPGVYLRDDPVFGSQLMNQSELRAPTAERAAFLLDAALAARTAVAGGRSRLHLFDLGSCEKTTKSRDGGSGSCLSLSALGNVILALFNGQKHVPYKDSKLTQLLREAMGSVMCRVAMIAHVSTTPSRYPETLATLQLASRIHRLRRKKLKFAASSELGPIGDDKGVCRPFVRIHAVGEDGAVKSGSSDPDYTSSSEQSCDTVIFVGSARSSPLALCDRRNSQPMSPLAKENQSTSTTQVGGSSKKQTTTKSHHSDKPAASSSTNSANTNATGKPPKTSDYVSKSALNEQIRTSAVASPKKKSVCSSPYSSPKHQKLADTSDSPKMSPKMSKYVMMDYSGDLKKSKGSTDSISKSSPSRSGKLTSSDVHQKTVAASTLTGSPQSQRKSKRSHKQDATQQQQIYLQQQQAESALKLLTKEPKPTSDETWIDGPRFTKPKFDSRTLHQLQKEKWVDGPGMYGYMDVQKETMIRKWVEDHSRIIPESERTKEVWIDFPPKKDEKSSTTIKSIPSESVDKHISSHNTEKVKKEPRNKSVDQIPHPSTSDTDSHIYAKPSVVVKEPPRQIATDAVSKVSKDKDVKPKVTHQMVSDLDNSINGNLSELLGHSDNGSSQSSSGSIDFNDNNSEFSEGNRCLSNSNLYFEDKDGCVLLTDNGQSDAVVMADSSIQVTEEDIFSTCGWPREVLMDNQHFSDTDSYEDIEHPLHALSADDLNLASSFTDSRAASVDFDTLSVPEGWTADSHIDPDLTRRLLRGGNLPHSSHTSLPRNLNSNEDLRVKNNLLASKLEKLANLRQMIERSNKHETWKAPTMPTNLSSFCSSENRFPFVTKLHHSADSSLEELRENDVNSIRSEPAELDIENFEFQFNVKPMNGLRLEAFYNKIQKVPLFPDCYSQFGKPTQVVPPNIKQTKYSKLPVEDLESLKSPLKRQINEKDSAESSPGKVKHRWSTSSSLSAQKKNADSSQSLDKSDEFSRTRTSSENLPSSEKGASKTVTDSLQSQPVLHTSSVEKVHSLTEIIQEQRCRVYSEGPSSNPVTFHSTKYLSQRTSKSRIIAEHSTFVGKSPETADQRYDISLLRQHPRKRGSPKLSPRNILGSHRNNQSKQMKQYSQYNYPSCSDFNNDAETSGGMSPSVSWITTHASTSQIVTEAPTQSSGNKSQILIRSTSTPTNPFANSVSSPRGDVVIGAESYSYISTATPSITTLTPTSVISKKEAKWAARQSSSGHGSDSSVISTDIKETKELLGKLSKTPQFSGTSSGYESMPRDSEGTPLSSSSQESGSEVGARKEARGRKGTRKKTQGSSKRSRSVPARPPVNGSPTWQQQQQQQQAIASPISRQQIRGRLVRDLHDPTLWKSEEDVCCTSLLCCRLLDFY
ncbi:Kinesin-like protein KIF26B like protein [Argiope bruennichi]|uniref:Kinesin-like protein KIF26B like protein n=1 Tax=Argiope bruennichi TaxID=94029 RepID=A0A8T0FA18_ARGBR|nr:Kinesin-like protein KIF26B like protein [Argiope bruennichi]